VDFGRAAPSATSHGGLCDMPSTDNWEASREDLERSWWDACEGPWGWTNCRRGRCWRLVEGRMGSIAPNLSAIVGSAVALRSSWGQQVSQSACVCVCVWCFSPPPPKRPCQEVADCCIARQAVHESQFPPPFTLWCISWLSSAPQAASWRWPARPPAMCSPWASNRKTLAGYSTGDFPSPTQDTSSHTGIVPEHPPPLIGLRGWGLVAGKHAPLGCGQVDASQRSTHRSVCTSTTCRRGTGTVFKGQWCECLWGLL